MSKFLDTSNFKIVIFPLTSENKGISGRKMILKHKILLRIYALTFLLILAMSGIYYYVFTRDVRERSQQQSQIGEFIQEKKKLGTEWQ